MNEDSPTPFTVQAWQEALIERITLPVYEKLRTASVAIAGLGGLGSHVAIMLARAGIGKLLLVDFDSVDASNLNRQAYSIRHLGRAKTEALAELLREMNPCVELELAQCRVTEENCMELFSPYKLVCEAFDVDTSKAMLVECLLSQSPDTRIVAASGLAGYGSANAIKTRRLMKRLYLSGDGESAVAAGEPLVAPRVMLCAAHQAQMLIRLILGEEEV